MENLYFKRPIVHFERLSLIMSYRLNGCWLVVVTLVTNLMGTNLGDTVCQQLLLYIFYKTVADLQNDETWTSNNHVGTKRILFLVQPGFTILRICNNMSLLLGSTCVLQTYFCAQLFVNTNITLHRCFVRLFFPTIHPSAESCSSSIWLAGKKHNPQLCRQISCFSYCFFSYSLHQYIIGFMRCIHSRLDICLLKTSADLFPTVDMAETNNFHDDRAENYAASSILNSGLLKPW